MIQFFADLEALSQAAAARIIHVGMTAVVERERFDLVLAGGHTPRRAYELVAERIGRDADFWRETHLWWGDERCVAPEDPQSNFRMVAETLLARADVSEGNVHRIPVDSGEPDAVADAYARVFPDTPDLVLLGMGPDGHTASIFPGSPLVDERERRFAAAEATHTGAGERITITPAGIFSARDVLVLVSGPEKAGAFHHVFAEGNYRKTPAALVVEATWFVTQDTAG
jgi:6-phosphogluconolactonase